MSETPEEDFVQTTEEVIRDRLLHVLTLYPGISPSMLQVGIGTAISPKMWHPVMLKLKENGIVVESETVAKAPNGRDLSYKKLVVASREDWKVLETEDPWRFVPQVAGRCPMCGADCYETPSGIACKNGHGGIDPVI
jgi:hypothetical protein